MININQFVGSSPRVWGTVLKGKSGANLCRFIPTCVGNCKCPACIISRHTVHPHVCGELIHAYFIRYIYNGSSPRVWGTEAFSVSLTFFCRFIPTCVGNCSLGGFIPRNISVHPHVCGELSSTYTHCARWHGSSPRVWGTVFLMR